MKPCFNSCVLLTLVVVFLECGQHFLVAFAEETQPWLMCRRMDGDKETCAQNNYCCYDDSTNRCFPPTMIDDLECPAILSQEICSGKYSDYCSWLDSDNRCIRNQINSDSACAAAIVQQRPEKDNTYCWGARSGKTCQLPFEYKGQTYTSCQSMDEVAPPKWAPKSTHKANKLWCPVASGDFSQPISGWDYCTCTERKRPKSVVMIVLDDMRPDLSFYGRPEPKTPFLDELASRPGSVILDRAYTLFPICAPSRACFLSGLSPDTTFVVDSFARGINTSPKLRKKMRPLPQLFKDNGYYSAGGGKLYHLHHDDPKSWNNYYFANLDQNKKACNTDKQKVRLDPANFTVTKFSCQTRRNVDSLLDFQVARKAVGRLEWIVQKQKEPFFLAIGFFKPHVPFHVNIKFWDLYRPTGVRPPERLNGPDLKSSFIANLTFDMDSELVSPLWAPDTNLQRRYRNTMRMGYLAGISQTDEAIGRVLSKMDELKLTDSTLVVIFGDNGLALGETGLFGKDTNFDISSRVPAMFHVPWLNHAGQDRKVVRMHDFFQLFDVYPTLAGLMDIPASEVHSFPVEGVDHSPRVTSLARRDSTELPPARQAAFSQVYRCPMKRCTFAPLQKMHRVGYSVRTDQWRYTVFLVAKKGRAQWDNIVSEELYSHENDDNTLFNYAEGVNYNTENFNLADTRRDVCAELFALIKDRFFKPLDLLNDPPGSVRER